MIGTPDCLNPDFGWAAGCWLNVISTDSPQLSYIGAKARGSEKENSLPLKTRTKQFLFHRVRLMPYDLFGVTIVPTSDVKGVAYSRTRFLKTLSAFSAMTWSLLPAAAAVVAAN